LFACSEFFDVLNAGIGVQPKLVAALSMDMGLEVSDAGPKEIGSQSME
jgi:hypothetical protein